MISPKFYSQITVCPACTGRGIKNIENLNYSDVCNECLGQGVSVVQSENIYIWDAPTFVDYKSRQRALIFKIIAVALIFIIFLLLILFVRSVVLNLITT